MKVWVIHIIWIVFGMLSSQKIIFAQTKNNLNSNSTITKESVDLFIQHISNINNDSILILGKQAIQMADQINYSEAQIKSRLLIGNYYESRKKIEAIQYFQEAKSLINTETPIALQALCYQNIAGFYYHIQPVFSEALKNAYLARDIYQKLNDIDKLNQVLTILGMIYNQQGEKEKALSLFEEIIEKAKVIHNPNTIAYISNCISDIYIEKGQYDKALNYNYTAIAIYDSLGEKRPAWGIAWTYAYIGKIYFNKAQIAWEKGDISTARQLYQDALSIYKKRLALELKIKSGSVDSYYDLGNWYLQMIRINEAVSTKSYLNIAQKHFDSSISNAKKDNELSVLSQAYLGKSIIDSFKGEYEAAFQNLSQYIQVKDSLDRISKSEAAIQMEMNSDFKKKEALAQLDQENRDKQFRIISSSLIIGLLGLGMFSFTIFKQRNKVKKEKHQSEVLLLNILPSQVAQELKEKKKVQVRQFDAVSVILIDFVSFTKTVENMPPKTLIQNLNQYFTAFDKIMDKYGLEKIKTIGDAYLAVCGLPNENNNHAKCTIQAALEIIEFIKLQQIENSGFNVRVGINSGSVVAGIVGVKKFAYDIWGDTVNIAARMESSSEAGKVNISETTYQLVKDDFTCEYRGEIEAKNKGMLKMYFVSDKVAQVAQS